MTRLLHLSDLHFGTERSGIVDILNEKCKELKPDYVILSGDLTQRATLEQYQSVMRFLVGLNTKVLAVPGNHDISLYNLFERFFYPFKKYKLHVIPSTETQLISDNVSIIGINSVTPYKAMSGYVTEKQLQRVTHFFEKHKTTYNIVVMHHNLVRSERHKIINNADKILNVFVNAGVNIVLSGHIHFAHIELLKKANLFHKLYIITAGTPISTRTIAPNSFNLITMEENGFNFEVYEYLNHTFTLNHQKFCPID